MEYYIPMTNNEFSQKKLEEYVEKIQNNLTILGPLYDYDPKTGKLTKVTY